MSTANLDPTTDGTRGTFTTLAGGTTNLGLAIDDYTGGGSHNSDTDGVMGPNNGDSQVFVLLSDTPSGFDPATISQVQIKSAYRLESAGVSGTADTCALFYQIFRSDETTAITTELSKGNITSTSYAEATDALTVTGSHTKTDWDGARLRIRQDYTIQGCADTTTRLRVSAAQIILTYSYAISSAGLTTAGLNSAATATETFSSTAAATVGGLSVAVAAAEEFPSTLAATTAGLSVSASASMSSGNTSDAALTVAGLNTAAQAAESFDATAAATTAGLSVDASLTTLYTTAALTTAGLSVAAAGSEAFPATAGLTTAGLSVDAAASEAFPSAAALTTAGLSVAATANRTSTGADAALTTAGLSVAATSSEEFAGAVECLLAGLSVDAVAEFASNDRDCTAELVTAGLSCFATMTGPSDVHLPEPEPPPTIREPLDDWIKGQQATVGGLTAAMHPSLWRKRGLSG